jgi:exosortase/archaeosortase family protein
MSLLRKIVSFSAIALFGAWIFDNLDWLRSDEDLVARFILGGVLFVAILFRPKGEQASAGPAWIVPVAMVTGTVMAMVGIIAPINQFEWVGILVLIYACLRWSMRPRFTRDLGLGLVLFYWVHPMPGHAFRILQLKMQRWSVQGTEWLLHCMNQAAWADGYVLRTGKNIFEIPAICSGMTTAVTVLLFSLGVGLLLRFRWWENVVFVLLSLVQVLALNILRITHMVFASDRMPREWAENFLHDTLGLYLVVSLFLVGAEASAWRAVRLRRKEVHDLREAGEVEHEEKATVLPKFWRIVVRGAGRGLVIILLVGAVFVAVVKRRDYHRSEMVARTMEALIATDLTRAEAAAREVLRLNPQNDDMRTSLCRVMLSREKFEAALVELDQIPEKSWDVEENVLRAWAFLKIGRVEESVALIDEIGMPGMLMPGLNMLKAEIAATEDDPAVASENIIQASIQPQMLERVRGLYPYLASREQWKAIAESDRAVPYSHISHALAAVFAHLRVRNFEDASTALDMSVTYWPDEPVFLDGLMAVAAAIPGGDSEARFEDHFKRTYGGLGADELGAYVEKCFKLYRPDLAWLAYRRLLVVDPDHPGVIVLPALSGHNWFRFRSSSAGIKSVSEFDTADLRGLYRFTRHMTPLNHLWDNVPLGDELSGDDVDAVVADYLRRGLEQVSQLAEAGELAGRMRELYPDLLARSGQYDLAHRMLDEFEADVPEKRPFVRLKHAELYQQQSQLDEAYEAVRDYFATAEAGPNLLAHVIMLSSVAEFRLGAYGMAVADEAADIFPDVPQVGALYVAMLESLGVSEQALFVARNTDMDFEPQRIGRLYYNTGRFSEAERLSKAHGFALPVPAPALQRLFPEPAEWVLARRWGVTARGDALQSLTEELRDRVAASKSAYFNDLTKLKLEWLRATDRSQLGEMGEWERIGRDGNEKGVALHELIVLLAQEERFEEAKLVAQRALHFMPRAVVLWRARIMLSGGDLETVREASRLRPYDPEIWLARILVEAKDEQAQEWFLEYLEGSKGKIAPATMARAGDYLFRVGKIAAANEAARQSIDSGQGLIMASMLGLRCAISTMNVDGALECAGGGAREAVEAWPFYMAVVDIKISQNIMDADLEQALNHLAERFPGDIRWVEGLMEVYYRQGRMKRVVDLFERVAKRTPRRLDAEIYILAAEAARQAGNGRHAAQIAARAYAIYPGKVKVINNLVYYLSSRKETLLKAKEIMETRLLANIEGSFATLDTAAAVYLRLGDFKKANAYINKALALVEPVDLAWPEINVNAAEIMIALRRYDDAHARLMAVRRDSKRSNTLDQRINRLLMVISQQTRL